MSDFPHYRDGLGDDPGRCVKHAFGYIEWRHSPALGVEIVNIEVAGEHRKRGIGRKLVEMLFEEVKASGRCRFVYAITRTDNLVAQQFYEQLRFQVVGVLRRFYGDSNNADAVMYGRSPEGPV